MVDVLAGGGGWTLDPTARAAMLLQAAREALARNEAAQAVALAEELLDTDPQDIEALLLVADAAPRYGHAEVGVLAATHARARGAHPGSVEAAALLAACQVEAALAAAEAVLVLDGTDARAHAIRGQALELLDRISEAEGALLRAHQLRPDAYPLPVPVPGDAWDTLLLEALSRLDDEDRDVLRGVDLRFEDSPDLALLRGLLPPPNPTLDGLLLHEEDGEAIVLFRRNLTRGTHTLGGLAERIRRALQAEAQVLLDLEGDA